VVLAGEVQARTAVGERLPDELAGILVETGRGGRDEHASDESLTEELLRTASDQSASDAERCTERLRAGLAHGRAVQGNEKVARAAEMGAVETLLLERGRAASREAFLLKTCAESGSAVDLVNEDAGLIDSVGALLRFPVD
jgi:stalled ribosome rescue protein Dom34